MLEPAHIVGISKTRYVLATPRFLEWQRDLPPTDTNDPSASDPQDPRRRPARRRGDRRFRLPAAVVLVFESRIAHRPPSHRAPWCPRRSRAQFGVAGVRPG